MMVISCMPRLLSSSVPNLGFSIMHLDLSVCPQLRCEDADNCFPPFPGDTRRVQKNEDSLHKYESLLSGLDLLFETRKGGCPLAFFRACRIRNQLTKLVGHEPIECAQTKTPWITGPRPPQPLQTSDQPRTPTETTI